MTYWRTKIDTGITPEMKSFRRIWFGVTVGLFLSAIWLVTKAYGDESLYSFSTQAIDAHSCALASIAPDKTVTVDWTCVHYWAQKYRAGATTYNEGIAHVLQTIKDGEAKSK